MFLCLVAVIRMLTVRGYLGEQGTLCKHAVALALYAVMGDQPLNKEDKSQLSRQTADILVKLLLRLDKKLQVGGVDDSNGIVGGFMSEVVGMLSDFAQMDPTCIDAFEPLCGKQTCFGWEEPLVRIFDVEIECPAIAEKAPSKKPPKHRV